MPDPLLNFDAIKPNAHRNKNEDCPEEKSGKRGHIDARQVNFFNHAVLFLSGFRKLGCSAKKAFISSRMALARAQARLASRLSGVGIIPTPVSAARMADRVGCESEV